MVELNSAARQLAAQSKIWMIDLELMSLPFVQAADYLRDAHHPNEAFLLHGFWNLVLNYVNLSCCVDSL